MKSARVKQRATLSKMGFRPTNLGGGEPAPGEKGLLMESMV